MTNPSTIEMHNDHLLFGTFEREDNHKLDEVGLVANLYRAALQSTQAPVGIMLDVGSCQGSAFKQFIEWGWKVHAFEPNPPMFAHMTEHCLHENLTLNQLAVCETSGDELPFFTSDESIGISALSPFRDSHKQTAVVKTIRLADYCEQQKVPHIDFLKIDTEGFDLMALRSLDWQQWSPAVVLCEFEDLKTLKLGYSADDLGAFLKERGYQVYASEWHPITRYGGGEHRWRAFRRWRPGQLPDNSWGNLVAFKNPPAEDVLVDTLCKTMNIQRRGAELKPQENSTSNGTGNKNSTPTPPNQTSNSKGTRGKDSARNWIPSVIHTWCTKLGRWTKSRK